MRGGFRVHGMGIDVVSISAFEAQLADGASSFLRETFTPGEQAEAQSRPGGNAARHLAARFAAKEAFIKAWSGGFFGEAPILSSINFKEIEVINDAWGRPSLRIHGLLRAAVGEGACFHLSMSHDGDVATAQVLIETPLLDPS